MGRMWVATRKGVFGYERSGSGAWKIVNRSFLSDNCSMLLHDERDGSLYAALGHGHFGVKMHRSRDGGATWQQVAPPTYPKVPEGTEPAKDPMGRVIPNSLELVWALEHGGTDRPGHLWCGTGPGALFHSKDAGESWNLVESLWENPSRKKWFGGGLDFPAIHSVCVHPTNSDQVSIGISCGGVWTTRDAGKTWACTSNGMRADYMPPDQAGNPEVQDPHRLVQCRTNPKAMWVQHHNGIFRSTDGETWSEIRDVKPSAFGFAVAVHPHDGDTAWFVPAIKDEHRIPTGGKFVVTRTRDGGKTFTSLSKGLPAEDAYDLVFRHALDIDSTGTTLAMGSTTGSLWVSEDQGDSWQTLSEHLPPIYCVRIER